MVSSATRGASASPSAAGACTVQVHALRWGGIRRASADAEGMHLIPAAAELPVPFGRAAAARSTNGLSPSPDAHKALSFPVGLLRNPRPKLGDRNCADLPDPCSPALLEATGYRLAAHS